MATSPLGPKNPSATFYWNDWENDEALKACSLAAQGLWMRLLCIAARSPEHGVVQIGSLTCGLPDGLAQIASAVGRPPQEIAPLIDELLSSGAASLDRKQRIMSRRMVKAVALHKKRSVAGKIGADVTNGKTTGKGGLPRQKSGKPPGKPPANDPALHTSRLHPSTPFETATESLAERQRENSPDGHGEPDGDWEPDNGEPSRSNRPTLAAGRAQLVPPDWQPSEDARRKLERSRPDITPELFERRMVEFHAWCLAENKHTHNAEATWLGFMVKTHAQRSSNTADQPTSADKFQALADFGREGTG